MPLLNISRNAAAPSAAAKSLFTARRKVTSSIHAGGAWIRGDIVLPASHSLMHHLNQASGFLRLTNVMLPGSRAALEFMALRADAFSFLLPGPDEHIVNPPMAEMTRHEVTCVFPFGYVNGSLEIVRRTRVSDFLAAPPAFFALHACTLHLNGHPPREAPIVIVNARDTIGVAHPALGQTG